MASKINTKFVILLTGGVTLLSGMLVAAAYFVLTKSGDEYVARGQQAEAQGDYLLASEMYGRAVGHDRTNVQWLHLWLDALTKSTPPTRVEYEKAYLEHYLGVLQNLATLQDTDAAVQRAYLEAVKQHNWWLNPSKEAWEDLANRTTRAVERLDMTNPDAKALLRYRGLAILNQMQIFTPTETVRDQALSDLRAAVEADPTDVESAIGIARHHLLEWRTARTARQEQRAANKLADLDAQAARLEQQWSESPDVQLWLLEKQIASAFATATTYAQQRLAVLGLQGAEQKVLDTIDAADPATINSDLVNRLDRILTLLRPEDGPQILVAIIDRALELNPNNPELLLQKGLTQGQRIDPEAAITTLELLAQLEPLPVSLQGMLLRDFKTQAIALQSENALRMWERTTNPDDKRAWMDKVKAYRAQVVEMKRAGAEDPAVIMLDARIAIAEQRYQAASAALQRYRQATSSNRVEVLRLLTRALIGENQLGAARQTVDELLALEPSNTQALLLASEIARRLGDLQGALGYAMAAVEIEPDNQQLVDAADQLRAMLGQGQVGDPVLQGLFEARRMLADAGPAGVSQSRDRLNRLATEHPDDVRPLRALLELEASMNDEEAVTQLIARVLALDPDDELALRMQRRLDAEDPVEFALSEIDRDDAPQVEKLLRKRAVLLSAERPEEAAALLKEAEALDARNRFVVEAIFIDAVESGRLDEAQRLQTVAAEINADDVNGDLYQAVLLQAAGNHVDAVAMLLRVTDRLPYSGRAWMLLGQSQMALGRVDQAIESLRKAFDARPDDIRAARTLVGALVQVQRMSDALEIARLNAELNQHAIQAQRLQLQLEEVAGDADYAIDRRERFAQANPRDQENAIALIRLYIKQARFTEAQARIDAYRAETGGDASLALTLLEARIAALQQSIDEGAAIVNAYIDSIDPGALTAEPFLALAEYFIEFERPDDALRAMQRGGEHQDPKVLEVDRRMGDFHFSRGEYAEAVAPYTRLIAIKSDDQTVILKRLAETHVRLEQWNEATTTLDQIASAGADDMEATLLRAEIALRTGDTRRAEDLLDEAVRIAPNNPTPFIRRAQAHMDRPELFDDAMQDLDQALRLRPNSVIARKYRAAMLSSRNRHTEAIADLRQGVAANPDSDDLRLTLVNEQIGIGAWIDAMQAVDAAVDARNRSVEWLRAAGDVYMQAAAQPSLSRDANRYRQRAAAYYREAQSIEPQERYAVNLLQALMSMNPPQPREALQVLDEIGELADTESQFLIMRALAHNLLNEKDEARRYAEQAFNAATIPDELRVWFAQIPRLFETPLAAANYMRTQTPPAGLEDLFNVQLCMVRSADISQRTSIIADLNAIDQKPDLDPQTRVDLLRTRSALEYAEGDFEAAAASLERGRALAPDDLEFNNNLAYVYAKELNRLQDAIAPAEKAAELSPNDAIVLDTLGWVYFRTNRIAQAEATLQRAVDLSDASNSDAQRIPANYHMAELMFAREEYRTSRRFLERAQEALRRAQNGGAEGAALAAEFGPGMDALLQRLNQAE